MSRICRTWGRSNSVHRVTGVPLATGARLTHPPYQPTRWVEGAMVLRWTDNTRWGVRVEAECAQVESTSRVDEYLDEL